MLFQRVVVAVDGSESSWQAFKVAVKLAKQMEAQVWLVSVEERLPHYAATVGEMQEEKEAASRYFQFVHERAKGIASSEGISITTDLVAGHVAQRIVEYTRQKNADLLVIGHSGHSGVWETFLGTTAEKVSRHAPCSVLIVR